MFVKCCLNQSQAYVRKGETDSAVFYFNSVMREVNKFNKQDLPYEVLLCLGDFFSDENNYAVSLEYYMTALHQLDGLSREISKTPDARYIDLYDKIAYSLRFYSPEEAVRFIRRNLQLADSFRQDSGGSDRLRMRVYNNIGTIYLENQRMDSARIYFEKSLSYCSKENDIDSVTVGRLLNNIAAAYVRDDVEFARQKLMSSLAIAEIFRDSMNMANIYLNLGKCAYLEQDFNSCRKFLWKSLDLSRKLGDGRLELYARKSLAIMYKHTGQFQESLRHYQIADELKDSLYSLDKTRASIGQLLKYEYQKQKDELAFRQQLEIKKREQRFFVFIYVCTILIFALVILLGKNRIQNIRMREERLKQKTLALENENLELRNANLEHELENKQKELNIHAQYLLKREDYMTSVVNQIKVSDWNEETNRLLCDVQKNINSSAVNELKILFQTLHIDFYAHLYERHPDLTMNEKRLCAFIHLNLSTKEISSITQQSVKSIEIARSRLRAKLGLKREENLSVYLQQF